MDEKCTRAQALSYLENLVGKPLRYGIKSHDTELYDFGFGESIEITDHQKRRNIYLHNLHILCDFKVIDKTNRGSYKIYYGNTEKHKFESDIQRIIGLKVKRVSLSDKNDLWLDFGSNWVVFVTCEDAEESWRYFIWGKKNPHLVVSDVWQEFVW